MFCPPNNVFTIFLKTWSRGGGGFVPLVDITSGAKSPVVPSPQNIVNHYLVHKTCLYLLGHTAYQSKTGVDTCQVDLLKNTLYVGLSRFSRLSVSKYCQVYPYKIKSPCTLTNTLISLHYYSLKIYTFAMLLVFIGCYHN